LIKLHPQQTLSVGMVLHELATNAGKYGALSNPAGHLSVDWSLTQPNEKGMVEISWREEGGPKTAHEPRIGFGLKLVARETEYNLRGKALIEFSASGLQATVRFPLSEEHA
jgi:two-component system CheB/CheR fusion protein